MKKILKENAIIRLNNHNPNIILIGEYVGLTNNTNFKCKKCGSIRFTSFYKLLNSTRKLGCIKCEKRKKNKKEKSRTKSHKQYLLEIYNIWGILLELLVNIMVLIKKLKLSVMYVITFGILKPNHY